MRRTVTIAVLAAVSLAIGGRVFADGCYLCEEGGYVRYQGEDSFAKRKAAKEKYACTVSGTTSTCSNSRGTVVRRDVTKTPRSSTAERGLLDFEEE